MAWHIRILPNDGFEIADGDLYRITRYTPDLVVSKTIRLPVSPRQLAHLGTGQMVISRPLSTPERLGQPLQLVDSLGNHGISFGADPPIQEVGNSDLMWRTLSTSRREEIWTARLTEYVLERWRTDGTRVAHLMREVPWFGPHDNYGFRTDGSEPPGPGIIAIHMDSGGLLWVAMHIPDDNWEDAYEPWDDPYGRPRHMVHDRNLVYDTVLEVINTDSGTVIASKRLDESIIGFTQKGNVFWTRFRDGIVPTMEVWEVQIGQTDLR